ncbi:2-amino-4-hydroxy-6-hydroxymethyldihydropteridine diphosphokinase [Specibacter sp. AOP5-B1-6]|uniref:2-amino-4-hydroxy-6- hydroxymethyldihydropteridine diphosphokinase n=1 Tax=Specibacter sp. AOP5-B1-6 TaxID=3457653 RepID=UPI00402B5166
MTAARALTRAILALGSNLGEREGTLQSAVADLVDRPEVRLQNVSPVVTTKAVGGPEGQPDFLNMVIAIDTTLSSTELLLHCQAVELAHHRTREVRWGARTLDVDIITYGAESSSDPALTLPHPRAAGRAFVLFPWSLMEPNATLAGAPVADLAAAAPDMAGISLDQDVAQDRESGTASRNQHRQ